MNPLENNFISAVESKATANGFIKTTDSPISSLNSAQKVALNRKGNEFFNDGKINEATRIFIATGYSDGLTRIGDFMMKKNEYLKALKFYTLAKNKRRCEAIYEKLAKVVSFSLKETLESTG
ncbi:hypothetical protein [Treponema pectinovorum]|uniref:hypothetical protein n=1 Tax=Treponema pectinovorum TaxID=164 RepID=UPI0011CC7AA1|nr:hypothetical protein [Treponema pectinovorum]